MRNTITLALAVTACLATPVVAQAPARERHRDERARAPMARERREPDLPRAPMARERPDAPPELDQSPHVYGGRWYGHAAPDDPRYELERPFAAGRFEREGPEHRFGVSRVDLDGRRLWLPGGYGFEVAAWEWPFTAGWCWDCGDDFVVYNDLDHPGWYLLYYIPTGQYVHVQYLGLGW